MILLPFCPYYSPIYMISDLPHPPNRCCYNDSPVYIKASNPGSGLNWKAHHAVGGSAVGYLGTRPGTSHARVNCRVLLALGSFLLWALVRVGSALNSESSNPGPRQTPNIQVPQRVHRGQAQAFSVKRIETQQPGRRCTPETLYTLLETPNPETYKTLYQLQ